LKFWSTIEICGRKSNILKVSGLGFSLKHWNFGQNRNLLSKIEIFARKSNYIETWHCSQTLFFVNKINYEYIETLKFWSKVESFAWKSNFWSKMELYWNIEILVKNRNLGSKIEFLIHNWITLGLCATQCQIIRNTAKLFPDFYVWEVLSL